MLGGPHRLVAGRWLQLVIFPKSISANDPLPSPSIKLRRRFYWAPVAGLNYWKSFACRILIARAAWGCCPVIIGNPPRYNQWILVTGVLYASHVSALFALVRCDADKIAVFRFPSCRFDQHTPPLSNSVVTRLPVSHPSARFFIPQAGVDAQAASKKAVASTLPALWVTLDAFFPARAAGDHQCAMGKHPLTER
jgi:hypothetical protein